MFNKKAVIPKSLEQWYLDPVSVSALRDLLNEPVFQVACATLVNAALPSFQSALDIEKNKVRHAWLAGYRDFLSDLLALTKAPATRKELQEEWSHIQ